MFKSSFLNFSLFFKSGFACIVTIFLLVLYKLFTSFVLFGSLSILFILKFTIFSCSFFISSFKLKEEILFNFIDIFFLNKLLPLGINFTLPLCSKSLGFELL